MSEEDIIKQFVNSDNFTIIHNYISKPYEETINDLQQKIDNTLEWIDRTIEIIKMQPSKDDTWILERLNSFKLCLKGDSNE